MFDCARHDKAIALIPLSATMSVGMDQLNSILEQAVSDQKLVESAAKNIRSLLAGAQSPLYAQAIAELI